MNVTVNAVRSGDWWAIDVPEVKGARSQARRLDQVAEMAADAVATVLDIEPEDVTVTEVIPVLDELDEVRRVREATQQARRAQVEATQRSTDAVKKLLASGMTVRDVGSLLDVTPQRVSQISKTLRAINDRGTTIRELSELGGKGSEAAKIGRSMGKLRYKIKIPAAYDVAFGAKTSGRGKSVTTPIDSKPTA